GWVAGIYLARRGSGVIFAVGDQVIVTTDDLWLRSGPGTDRTTVGELGNGAELTITASGIANQGHTWYGVHSADAGDGWAVAIYLAPA
ncbi:MAG TPA: hypothetical protein PK691_11810, partial [Thermomicrobiales bacterium]|nr:hypothetical protein [Thermomicrobiales bacterium]